MLIKFIAVYKCLNANLEPYRSMGRILAFICSAPGRRHMISFVGGASSVHGVLLLSHATVAEIK